MSAEEAVSELVGRDELVESIAESLRAGIGGAAVFGDVGLGKSAMVDLLLRRFEDEMLVFHLHASAALGTIAYGALSQFVRGLNEAELDSPLLTLRRLKSNFQELQEEVGRPVLLIVDDAHELDESSSHVLEQLLMAGVIRIVVLGRDYGSKEGIFALSRDGLLGRFELAPLTEEEVRQYAERELHGPVAPGTVARFTAWSGGNPYLLKAMVSHALRTGQLEEVDGVWVAAVKAEQVDPFLTNLVKELLQRCIPMQWNLIQTVALLEPVTLSVLAEIVDAGLVSALIDCGMLNLANQGTELVTIRHPLCADVARRGVPVGRSRKIRQQALALMGHALPRAIGHVRWVSWSLDIGEEVDDEDLLGAAGQANIDFDPEIALRFAAAVVSPGKKPEAQIQSAYAHLCTDEIDEAVSDVESALASATDGYTLDSAALVAAAIALHTGRAGTAVATVADTWERRHTHLTPGEQGTGLTGTLLRASSEQLAGRHSNTLQTLEDLVVSGSGYPREQLLARILLAEALDATGRNDDAVDVALQAGALLRSDLSLAAFYPPTLFRCVLTLLRAGKHDDAIRLIDKCSLSAPPRYVYYGGETPALRGIVLIHQGRVAEGLSYLTGGIAALRKCDAALMLPYAVGHAAFATMLLGDTAGSQRLAADFDALQNPGPESEHVIARGYVAAALGRLNSPDSPGLRALAEQARAEGMTAAERELLELLTLLGGTEHLGRMAELAAGLQGETGRSLRLIAESLLDEDPEAIVAAAGKADAVGLPLLGAECLARAARAYAEQGASRMERATLQQLKRHPAGLLKARTDLRKVAAVSLTPREREIVRLVLAGLTNAKIARKLTVSTRTVEGHLYRIYLKLGISQRDELVEEHLL